MSRSNPTANVSHPATRWFEWDGARGGISYYDKELPGEKNGKPTKGSYVSVKIPFGCLVLDETSAITGWHEKSESGIYSNEVKDTRDQVMLVKSFKGGELAHGLYAQIRDRIVALGGKFTTNIYIGFKNSAGGLELGVLQFTGAALSAWMDFRKKSGKSIFEQALVLTGFTEGKKGSVVFQTPTFKLTEVSPETNAAALDLDKALQEHFTAYFAKGVTKAAAETPKKEPDASWLEGAADETPAPPKPGEGAGEDLTSGLEEEDIPF